MWTQGCSLSEALVQSVEGLRCRRPRCNGTRHKHVCVLATLDGLDSVLDGGHAGVCHVSKLLTTRSSVLPGVTQWEPKLTTTNLVVEADNELAWRWSHTTSSFSDLPRPLRVALWIAWCLMVALPILTGGWRLTEAWAWGIPHHPVVIRYWRRMYPKLEQLKTIETIIYYKTLLDY